MGGNIILCLLLIKHNTFSQIEEDQQISRLTDSIDLHALKWVNAFISIESVRQDLLIL